MKTKVVIWEGETSIVLHAENDFERDRIEKIEGSRTGYDILTTVETDYRYQSHKNHRIEIKLEEKQNHK